MKICTKCSEKKNFNEFHKDKTHADGFRSSCKVCVLIYSRVYYDNNREKIIGKATKWNKKNVERHLTRCYRWVKDNKGKVNARTARRYAAKTSATPAWVVKDKDINWWINEIYNLATLRSAVTGAKWEVDHIIPLRGRGVSGLHVPWNLRVVVQRENRIKSNKVDV